MVGSCLTHIRRTCNLHKALTPRGCGACDLIPWDIYNDGVTTAAEDGDFQIRGRDGDDA